MKRIALAAVLALPLASCSGTQYRSRSSVAGGLAAGGDRQKMTEALAAAAASGWTDLMARALDAGADPNGHSKEGYTPLVYAISNNRIDAAKLLIAKGADTSGLREPALAFNGKSAVEYSDLMGRSPMAGLLRDATAPARGSQRGPGNLDDAAYDRMRAAAEMPPEKKAPVSDVDSPSRRGETRPDDFALVIGIEKYSRLPEAAFAENDADSMKKHLLALGYPERNIVLLKGGQATRGAISGYVEEWLPKNAKPASRVFVYFSGHGSPDTKSGDAYLVPWDGDAMFLKSTAYPLKSLYASLGKLKAKRVLVALDSCFSGAGGRSVLAEGARPLVTRVDEVEAPAGVTVLSAASGDEITATIKEQGHGAFTYYLLKAFNNGKLTAKAAYAELKPLVQDEAHRQNREQTPLLLGDDATF
jgi:hypothetical protein